jgi:hypothetical protein
MLWVVSPRKISTINCVCETLREGKEVAWYTSRKRRVSGRMWNDFFNDANSFLLKDAWL